MPCKKNIDSVAELTEKFQRAEALIMVDYRGLNAGETTQLRAKAREAGVELRVRKNRLIKLALANAELDPLDDILVGPTAVAFGYDDPVAPAKLVAEFAKNNSKLEIKGGILEGKALDKDAVGQLASAPSREDLIARMMGSMMSPAQNFVYVLEASRSKIVHALDAIARKREEEGEAA